MYNKSEQEKVNEGKARLEILQRRLHDQERKILRGKDAVDLDDDLGQRGRTGRPVAAAARRQGTLSDGSRRSRALADHSSESEPSDLDSGSMSDSGSSHVSMDDDHGRRGRGRGGRGGRSRSRSMSESDDLLDDDDDLSGSDGSQGSRGRRRGGSFSGTDSDNEF